MNKLSILLLLTFSSQLYASIEALKIKVKEKQKSEEKCLFYSQLEEDKITMVSNYLMSENLLFFQQGQNILISFDKENNKIIKKLIENNEAIKSGLGNTQDISDKNSKLNATLNE